MQPKDRCMAAMPGQRAGNTLVGQAGLCGVSHWLPVKTQGARVYCSCPSSTSTLTHAYPTHMLLHLHSTRWCRLNKICKHSKDI